MRWGFVAAAVLVVDEILKRLALAHPAYIHKNFGIAFDIPLPSWAVIAVTSAIIAVSAWELWKHRRHAALAAPLCFIIAGGIGNLYDRLTYGYIIDYIILFGRSAFDLCDFMILGGVLALIVVSSRHGK